MLSTYQKESREIIEKALPQASQVLVSLLNVRELTEDQARAAQLNYKSSAHILKIGGLEVDRHEHTGKGGTSLVIGVSHAEKILTAAEL